MSDATTRKPVLKPLGEVIYSSTNTILVQCYKEGTVSIPYKHSVTEGSIVKIEGSYDNRFSAYGLVTKICNTSLDNIHKPSALGLSSKELEELQPQVYDLLRKELEICLFAYREEKIINYKPTKLIMIHDIVYDVPDNEIRDLTSLDGVINLINIVKTNQLNPNLLVDLISGGYRLRSNEYSYLVQVGQKLSLAFSDEIDNLIQILKRLSPPKETISQRL